MGPPIHCKQPGNPTIFPWTTSQPPLAAFGLPKASNDIASSAAGTQKLQLAPPPYHTWWMAARFVDPGEIDPSSLEKKCPNSSESSTHFKDIPKSSTFSCSSTVSHCPNISFYIKQNVETFMNQVKSWYSRYSIFPNSWNLQTWSIMQPSAQSSIRTDRLFNLFQLFQELLLCSQGCLQIFVIINSWISSIII